MLEAHSLKPRASHPFLCLCTNTGTGGVPAAAAIKYIYPNTGPTAGGTELTIVGTCLGAALQSPGVQLEVTLGTFACDNARVLSKTRLVCEVGQGFGAMNRLKVLLGASKQSIPCASSDAASSLGPGSCSFHYQPPTVFGSHPALVPTGGGRTVTVLGKDFGHPIDWASLTVRVVVAGQVCEQDKTAVCPNCGYSQDGVVVCVVPANTRKTAARVTIQIGSTLLLHHECSECPHGYVPERDATRCQCQALGSGGKVHHMSSWGKMTLWLGMPSCVVPCACPYVFVCVCVFDVCCVCVCGRERECVCVCACARVRHSVHLCVPQEMVTCILTCVCVCVCVRACACVCM